MKLIYSESARYADSEYTVADTEMCNCKNYETIGLFWLRLRTIGRITSNSKNFTSAYEIVPNSIPEKPSRVLAWPTGKIKKSEKLANFDGVQIVCPRSSH